LTEKVTGAFPSSRSTTNNLKGVATPMTDLKIALMELLRKYQPDQDMLREGLQLLAEALMELEVTQKVGAGRYERTSQRTNYRNGYRLRNWDTRVGTIALRIPRLRQGGYLPCFLEPRRRAERALLSVIQEAYAHGVSTRKVDDLVQALGLEGVSKSEVSRICQELDEKMAQFRNRPLDGEYPYVWLDAKAVQPGAARAEGRAPGDFRCPRGPETGHRRGAARGGLAAVSGTLHAQPAGLCPQAGPVHGGGAGPDGFRPA